MRQNQGLPGLVSHNKSLLSNLPSLLSLCVLAVVCLLMSGCGFVDRITAERSTTTDLTQTGFLNAKVTVSPTKPASPNTPASIVVVLSAMTPSATGLEPPPGPQQFTDAAQSVWDTFPYGFSQLSITISGFGTETYTYQELASQLGARPAKSTSKSMSQVLFTAWQYVMDAIYGVIGLVVLVIVFKFLTRNRERKAKVAPDEGKYGSWHHQHVHGTKDFGRSRKGRLKSVESGDGYVAQKATATPAFPTDQTFKAAPLAQVQSVSPPPFSQFQNPGPPSSGQMPNPGPPPQGVQGVPPVSPPANPAMGSPGSGGSGPRPYRGPSYPEAPKMPTLPSSSPQGVPETPQPASPPKMPSAPTQHTYSSLGTQPRIVQGPSGQDPQVPAMPKMPTLSGAPGTPNQGTPQGPPPQVPSEAISGGPPVVSSPQPIPPPLVTPPMVQTTPPPVVAPDVAPPLVQPIPPVVSSAPPQLPGQAPPEVPPIVVSPQAPPIVAPPTQPPPPEVPPALDSTNQ